jgi:cytochrome c553
MNLTFSKFLPVVVSSLVAATSAVQAQTITPSATAGEKKAAMCIGCHGIPGYQASFPEIHKVPMIGGQSAKYLVAALTEYQKGDRKHPTMKGIAASLTEQDMADLAAFYEKQSVAGAEKAVPAAPPKVAALLEKGKCVTCHGTDFNTSISPEYPKLAGQYADYLYVALKAYQVGGNPMVGRSNPTMQAQVQGFTHAELKLLAGYLGSLKTDLTTHAQPRFR